MIQLPSYQQIAMTLILKFKAMDGLLMNVYIASLKSKGQIERVWQGLETYIQQLARENPTMYAIVG